MPEPPLVLAAILNWNGEQDTIEAVRSVQALEYPRLEIVVLDNGSRPESLAAIREACPNVELVENGGNLGYAGGNNAGLRLAIERKADLCFVLNNDLIVDPPMLNFLIEAARQDPAIAILGPRVYRYDVRRREQRDELFYPGWRIDWRRWLFYRAPAHADKFVVPASAGEVVDVDWVQGCAMLIRADFLREHGLFDERYHLYCEDADLCVRAQRAGRRTVEVAAARIWHKGYASSGKSSPLKNYYGLRNRLLFISKHAPRKNRLRLRLQLLVFDAGGQALRAAGRLLAGPDRRAAGRTLRALFRAAVDWGIGRFGPGPGWLFRGREKRKEG